MTVIFFPCDIISIQRRKERKHMGILFSLKRKLMLTTLKKKNSEHPFNLEKYETYQLSPNATLEEVNSYYFSAHTLEGESLVIRQELRGGGREDIWIIFHTKEGTYVNRQNAFQNGTSGLTVSLMEVAKKWAFSYKGKLTKMKIDDDKLATFTDEESDFEINGVFEGETSVFDYTYHLDPILLATPLAKEKWTKEFKKNLKTNQQTRLDQQGHIEANICFDNHTIHFKANAFKEHIFGRRDWDNMKRHIRLMALIRQGESLNLNRASHIYIDNLQTGYYEKDGRTHQISLKTNTARIPVLGYIPVYFAYHVELQNGLLFDVKAAVEVIIPFKLNNGKYTLLEGIGAFDVNKRKARGIIEFGFHEDKALWDKRL